jgi:glyoxylase-like metal-dependent hydrolase (beta-lactamase superfamily II)
MNAISLPTSMQVFERGWLSSNNILFTGSDTGHGTTALIDSGYLTHAEQTLALVRHALQERPLELLINTHLHSDHCGGNALLQRHYAVKTLVPASETDAVQAWDQARLSYQATGQRCERFRCDGSIAHGDCLQLGGMAWQVISAPGHDPHSMILYCPQEGILISADALWENGFGVIFPELEGESGFAEQAAILATIAELNVRIVIPGHGAPFTDVRGALQRAGSRLDYLAADTRRNARNAIKVMIAFLLLEQRQLHLPDLHAQFGDQRLLQAAATQLQIPAEELFVRLGTELAHSGAARLEAGMLFSPS